MTVLILGCQEDEHADHVIVEAHRHEENRVDPEEVDGEAGHAGVALGVLDGQATSDPGLKENSA